jgi:hypothetical protein
MFCKVQDCRYPFGHVTKGHMCGTCRKFGHGQIECKNPDSKTYLNQFNETLPDKKKCTINNCAYSDYHITEAHFCKKCRSFGHDCNNIFEVECPVCREINKFDKNPQKIFGISNQCPICVSNTIDMIFPKCSHACVCLECFEKMKKIDTPPPVSNHPAETPVSVALGHMGNTDGKIYLSINAGMGCAWYYRRDSAEAEIESFFMHSDNWGQYGPETDDRPKLDKFMEGYTSIGTFF